MAFIYELDPYPLKMYLQTVRHGFRKLSYYRQTNIQTYIQTEAAINITILLCAGGKYLNH